MKYAIDYYKTENLSPDEQNAMRRNQRGIWLHTGYVGQGESGRAVLSEMKRDPQFAHAYKGFKLRSRQD